MYFSAEVQERILAKFHFALRPRGFLVVGKAEALQKGRRLFMPHNLRRRIFVKDGSAEPGFRLPRLGLQLEPASDSYGAASELGDSAFEHAPVAQIVLDQESKVAAINQSTR
jgi:two-component system CheB/CheR fusion protein